MLTITEKIIKAHLVEGEMRRGAVSYTHLDVYKRQITTLMTVYTIFEHCSTFFQKKVKFYFFPIAQHLSISFASFTLSALPICPQIYEIS